MKLNLAENVYWLAKDHGLPETINKKTGELGISQIKIEKLTKVAQTTISGIVRQGKIPRMTTLQKLAKGFHVELWQLLAPLDLLKASRNKQIYELISNYSAAAPDGQESLRNTAKALAGRSHL